MLSPVCPSMINPTVRPIIAHAPLMASICRRLCKKIQSRKCKIDVTVTSFKNICTSTRIFKGGKHMVFYPGHIIQDLSTQKFAR